MCDDDLCRSPINGSRWTFELDGRWDLRFGDLLNSKTRCGVEHHDAGWRQVGSGVEIGRCLVGFEFYLKVSRGSFHLAVSPFCC
jgi:hypothetical protein